MSSNKKYNEKAIKQFRKELMAMLGDIEDIDIKVLNKSVNIGLEDVKKNSPVGSYTNHVDFITKEGKKVSFTTSEVKQGGWLRRSWRVTRANKSKKGVSKTIYNNVDYAAYVNYGHRVVNKLGETIGWVKGKFMLEKAIKRVDKEMVKSFKEEIKRINKKYDK
ncbi:HK97 gp10 family phage protein [Clostridium sp.]|uniref:HK97 gp10 family phage protein n=1 Tax=Clostridium sp. TaxID=1506 RepID=UPI00290E833F|nr:HK97 gp10 family phage protein [Clostridium sp.]MDU4726392.1 HK97 gp10 family phage protein [Clostridium sp.]